MHFNGIVAGCSFLLSIVFKVFHLMGAPTLLLISAFFGMAFLMSIILYKFTK